MDNVNGSVHRKAQAGLSVGGAMEWIPVTERLPPDGSEAVWVIVQHDNSQYMTKAWKIDKVRAKDYEGSPWIMDSDTLSSFEHIYESLYITHWMPINLPPFPQPIKDFHGYAVAKDVEMPPVILYK